MPYYHVIVSLKSRPEEDALAIDLSQKDLLNKILEPKLEGRKFACNWGLVDLEDMKSIRIMKTEKSILDIIGGHVIPTYTQYWEAANSGEDVTRDYIAETGARKKATSEKSLSRGIFIVHGRDHAPMKELKAILRDFGLNPIVLHEQPSGSRTIVEKLEKYSNVGYAFVILTPDDVGCVSNEFRETVQARLPYRIQGKIDTVVGVEGSPFKSRARQNVVLEFGYFIGKLGRDRVCCLHKGEVELPSDMHGIVYIPFENSVNEVRNEIVKELKAAGCKLNDCMERKKKHL